MPTDKPASDRPEAGADTGQGRKGRPPDGTTAESGGTRTRAGSDYGDFVPERVKHSDDRDTAQTTPQAEAEREETAAEANRNKTFDTTHVHSGTTTRKV